MKRNFLTRYPMFVALVFIKLSAFGATKLTLGDGASLRIPDSLCKNLSVMENTSSKTVISGAHPEKNGTIFIFASEYYRQGLDPRGQLLSKLGVESLETEILVTDQETRDVAFYKITNGPYTNFLLAEKSLKLGKKRISFFLFGSQAGFYKMSPEFWMLTNGYRPPTSFTSVERREVDIRMVGLALLVVFMNTIVIWRGLKKFGQYKLEIL